MIKDDHNNDANIVKYNFMKLRFFFKSKKKGLTKISKLTASLLL